MGLFNNNAQSRIDAMEARVEARCSSARAAVQGRDSVASSGGLLSRMSAKGNGRGSRSGSNSGSRRFNEMVASESESAGGFWSV